MKNYTVFWPDYSIGTDVYNKIPEICLPFGKKAVVIGGHKAMAAAKGKLISAIKNSGLEILDFVWFGGEATYENVDMLNSNPSVNEADMIFAVGGGKAVDTCKALCVKIGKPFFTFPTIASNCAAATTLAIMYKADGSFLEFYHFDRPAEHVFIDTKIIVHAPIKYLWAGIGDTYAKYYEVSVSARGAKLPHYQEMGVHLSRMCMEPLIEYGEEALNDNKQHIITDGFEQTVLTIIITTGMVSLLVSRDHSMDYNGGVAHAVFYGLTIYPELEKNHIHGEVVGFGVLFLLLIDGQREEYEKIAAFNKRIGLPTHLSDIGITLEQFEAAAEGITKDEDLEHYPYKVTAEMLINTAKLLI